MQSESVEDEFELFRAQSYGVESVLRHQRAASVRASSRAKLTPTAAATTAVAGPDAHGDFDRQSPDVAPPQPRPAAERKASFKSSARRRIQRRIPEEAVVVDDDQTISGSGRSAAVDDVQLARVGAVEDAEVDDASPSQQDLCRVYRMRSFYCKSGNIVNRGDSMRLRAPAARRARDHSPSTTGSSGGHAVSAAASEKQSNGRQSAAGDNNRAPSDTAVASRDRLTVGHISTSGPAARRQKMNGAGESTEDVASSAYRVLVLGSNGVGKTTLTEQLMTSEYLANKESFAGTSSSSFSDTVENIRPVYPPIFCGEFSIF